MKKCIPVLFIATAFGILAYWVDFFLIGTVKARHDNLYLSFQAAFPLADLWLAFCLLKTAVSYYRRQEQKWIFFGLSSSSAMIFLALVDTLFNFNQGIYKNFNLSVLMEIIINIWLFSLGIITGLCFYKDLAKSRN